MSKFTSTIRIRGDPKCCHKLYEVKSKIHTDYDTGIKVKKITYKCLCCDFEKEDKYTFIK